MPSGSQVQAYLRSAGNPNLGKFWSLDVYVRVFEENNGALEGLCGNFDGDSSNDIQDAQFGSVSSGDAAASQFR